MPSADEIRDRQRATWAGLAAGWEKWDSIITAQLGPVGAAMIERLDIADDQQHLDIAAGTGEPGLSIAQLSPKGRVVLTDLVAAMLDIATRRASAHGIANVESAVCSADELPFDDASFDSISVRFGPAQYWEMIGEHLSLAVAALQRVDEPARQRIGSTAVARVSPFERDGKIRVPGVARCIVGTKARAS
jgi:SAM-dependent methyltransferase